ILSLGYLFVLGSGAIEPSEPKLTTKLTPVNSPSYENNVKDLTAAASDRTFHLNKDYQPGVAPYGSYLGLGGSIYGPGTAYRGTGLSPGYLNPGYRGYPVGGPGGIIGGGHIGYGYYGNLGYNPGYKGYGYLGYDGYGGGYGGYGGSSLGGYGGYGSGYGPSGYSYGSGIYDDGYYGYGGRGSYGRYDGYGYGTGYGGYGGSNYGSSYNVRGSYDPYYRSTNYAGYTGNPSGYRGYS
ncbi:unnamed protein product, partial [Heterotrigona itama]